MKPVSPQNKASINTLAHYWEVSTAKELIFLKGGWIDMHLNINHFNVFLFQKFIYAFEDWKSGKRLSSVSNGRKNEMRTIGLFVNLKIVINFECLYFGR